MGSICTKDKSLGDAGAVKTRTTQEAGAHKETVDKNGIDCFKLLLLGSGESGKSTLFKQLMLGYGKGFDDKDREDYAVSIFENINESMKTLIKICRMPQYNFTLDAAVEGDCDRIMQRGDSDSVSQEDARAIARLWGNESIQKAYGLRTLYQLPDGCEYFFKNIEEVVAEPYVPTIDHVLRCRDRTTGVTSEILQIRSNQEKQDVNADFHVFDVGGQRAERRHWVRVFQDVKTVLFVVALSEYDQVMFEDGVTNRLDDAVGVFRMVANSKHFETTPIVLIFNKIDLFKSKIEGGKHPFSFDGYSGPQTYEAICPFVQEKFEMQNKTSKKIMTKFVCALNNDIDFNNVFKMIVAEV